MTDPFNSPVLARGRPSGARRRWPAVPLLLAAILVLATAQTCSWHQRNSQRNASASIIFPPCESHRPQITIAVLDVSSSVIDPRGADPSGRSFQQARRLAAALADKPCTRDDRFGAVIFADKAVEVPPTLVTSQSVIEKTLVRPPRHEIGGGTDLTRAIDLADQVAQRFPRAEVTAVVLSDMQTSDPSTLSTRLQATALDHIHLVALGDHDPQHDSNFDTVAELADAKQGAIAIALADAITASRTAGAG